LDLTFDERKMHKYILFLSVVLFSASCSLPKAPEFQSFQEVRAKLVNLNTVQLRGKAVYTNPNSFSTTLVYTDLDVYMDGKLVGKLEQKEKTGIPADGDFYVPVSMEVNIKDLRKEHKGLLKESFRKMFKEELDLRYKGSMTFEIMGQEIKAPIDYSEKVSIGVNWD
jgi:LEA14-like dessication related protein